ncbi:hypothetical protein BD779DRAFT_1469457 [Infundibulicybe gibba]|nr:hypothetical protein BD779DRAFT_1469457 [Infundibulicybe gibba]
MGEFNEVGEVLNKNITTNSTGTNFSTVTTPKICAISRPVRSLQAGYRVQGGNMSVIKRHQRSYPTLGCQGMGHWQYPTDLKSDGNLPPPQTNVIPACHGYGDPNLLRRPAIAARGHPILRSWDRCGKPIGILGSKPVCWNASDEGCLIGINVETPPRRSWRILIYGYASALGTSAHSPLGWLGKTKIRTCAVCLYSMHRFLTYLVSFPLNLGCFAGVPVGTPGLLRPYEGVIPGDIDKLNQVFLPGRVDRIASGCLISRTYLGSAGGDDRSKVGGEKVRRNPQRSSL